jgi:HSP20 family protein
MNMLIRRDYRGPFGDMLDWVEAPWTIWHPATGHPMRVEDFVKDGSYVVKAELPGIDPEKDVEVAVAKGVLTIRAERREEATGKHHSEFRYGTFSRSVTLPTGADEEHIDAVYGHGILEVTVHLADKSDEEFSRKIPIRQNQHIKPS